MKLYAVRLGRRWYIASKARNADYGVVPPEKEVWSREYDTALICEVGGENDVIELPEGTA